MDRKKLVSCRNLAERKNGNKENVSNEIFVELLQAKEENNLIANQVFLAAKCWRYNIYTTYLNICF